MNKICSRLLLSCLLLPALAQAGGSDSDCTYTGGAISSQAMCYSTPQSFNVTIYKLGVCTANPMLASTPDFRSCTLLINGSGQRADLAVGTSVVLANPAIPPNGTYHYAVIVADNSIGISNTQTYSGYTMTGSHNSVTGPTCWTVVGTVTQASPTPNLVDCGTTPAAGITVDQINDFANGTSEDPSNGGTFHAVAGPTGVAGGMITATLATSSLTKAVLSDWNNHDISRIIAVEAFSNPVKIDASSNGLNIGFVLSNSADAQISGGDGNTGDNGTIHQYGVSAFGMDFTPR
jgi:hypothetical protein